MQLMNEAYGTIDVWQKWKCISAHTAVHLSAPCITRYLSIFVYVTSFEMTEMIPCADSESVMYHFKTLHLLYYRWFTQSLRIHRQLVLSQWNHVCDVCPALTAACVIGLSSWYSSQWAEQRNSVLCPVWFGCCSVAMSAPNGLQSTDFI